MKNKLRKQWVSQFDGRVRPEHLTCEGALHKMESIDDWLDIETAKIADFGCHVPKTWLDETNDLPQATIDKMKLLYEEDIRVGLLISDLKHGYDPHFIVITDDGFISSEDEPEKFAQHFRDLGVIPQ